MAGIDAAEEQIELGSGQVGYRAVRGGFSARTTEGRFDRWMRPKEVRRVG